MIRIFNTSLSSSSDSPEVLTAELGQQTSPGRRGIGRKSSGHRSPGGGVSLVSNKRLTLPFLALLVVLAAGLLFLMPGGLLQAQSADQFITYAENGEGPVATFTASDPEGATPGYWSLVQSEGFAGIDTDGDETNDILIVDVADENLFKIDQNGVLSFKTPRSYEDDSNSVAGIGAKEYRVTVQVSDGSMVEYFKAYVTVTDVEETGKVTWTVAPSDEVADSDIRLQQFQPGAVLTPSVTDPDGDATVTAWKWYRGSTAISGQTAPTYIVVSGDVSNRIRVDATYTDGRGPAETVSFTSENPVQEFRRDADNETPAFSPTAVTRRVDENSKGNVGGPVTATDANNGDKLTYTLGGTGAASFEIDMATGQLMVGDGVEIDYEGADSYEVTVTATDSAGDATDPPATVTINVINVDEKPTFDAGSTAAGVIMAQTEGRTAIDLNNDTDTGDTDDVATLVASEPEGKKVTLSLMGDDAGSFELADDTQPGNAVSQVLSFKEKTDYEMPGDRNRDNVYEVTVRASDGTMNADRMLIIKVINDDTESGKVTVTPEDVVVGVELTASLTHMEGGVSASGQVANLMWQWQNADEPNAQDTCADVVLWTAIDGATKAAYTPVSGTADGDEGKCLSAMVTYNYQFAAATTTASSDGTLVLVSQANQAPKFKEGTSTFRVVMEDVAANAADDDPATDSTAVDTNDNVGSPVVATDANGDNPTYTLGGADTSLFRVRTNGQIEVKGELDHEMDSSHTVTLTANDGSGTSNSRTTITVTIYVADVDEMPTIKDRADSTAEGMRTVEYRENGDGPVARFTASDPEDAAPIYWSLTDVVVDEVVGPDIADRALFKIDQSGVLTFKEPPSYEADSGSGSGDDEAKNYQVVVQVSDGNRNVYFKLTVAVTNKEETGKVTWTVAPGGTALVPPRSLQQFQPGAVLTPTVTDPDSVTDANEDGSIDTPANITWKWYRGLELISGQTEATYTVGLDGGNRIRVEATYTDDSTGPAETVRFTSENPVQSAAQPGTNTAPAFSPTAVTRRVDENSKGNVGGPVTATDANGDKLTYSIPDNDNFVINPATGQLMVKAGASLDYEGGTTSYTVTVTATDSVGNTTDPPTTPTPATVTINVINVDEKPTFDAGSTAAGVIMAQTEGRTAIDLNNDTDTGDTDDVATLVASEPEGKKVTLSLMGDDAGSFELADDTQPGNAVSQVLSFKEKTDYEMPGDRNRDNVYEVTVRASDGTMNADRMLIIKVINDDTESGKVTVTPEDAVVGVELTASLTHMEGGVSASGQVANLMWQWQNADEPNAQDTCADVVLWTAIDGATKAAYTPVSGTADGDEGKCLSAMVTYNYQFAAATTTASSDGTLVLVSQANQAPKFKEGTSTFRVVMEDVAANAADDDPATDSTAVDTNDNVGSPVVATDANGDNPTYTLGGADTSLFRVRTNGQIEVKGELDHEMDSSHTVTLTANDGSGTSNATARITVTIYVTDVDEKPTISVGPPSGLVISGPGSRRYAENGRGAVATYTAIGPDAATARWSLAGNDAGDFRISTGGELTFGTSPDYEAAADANRDNVYMVTVTANDGTNTATEEVTVTVTNMDEDGTVSLSSTAPAVGTALTASVTDPDSVVTGTTTWQWARSSDGLTGWANIPGAMSASYTPVDPDDVGMYLQAMAMYADGHGTGKDATEMTASVVVAEAPPMTLLERYDTAPKDGKIDKDEARVAVLNFFDGVITKDQARKVVLLYFDGLS